MKIGIIDIGSNSVRLAMLADGKTLYKRLATTRLGAGLNGSGRMSGQSMEKTVKAISEFKALSEKDGAEKLYAFATAAVRSAENGMEFVKNVKDLCDVEVDVVDGETEARLGILGALRCGDGGIIDVGGASTEVSVSSGGDTVYSKSVDIGAVRLYDLAGRDKTRLEEVISGELCRYGAFSAAKYDMYAIGGTATTIASVKHGLKIYDAKITDGTQISAEEIFALADKILALPVDKVRNIAGMEPGRADVIGGGCLLLGRIMERFGIEKITVSESDNIEGYYMLREGTV